MTRARLHLKQAMEAAGRISGRYLGYSLVSLSCSASVFAALPPANQAAAVTSTGQSIPMTYNYAIQLAMYDNPPRLEAIPDLELLHRYRLYVTRANKDGATWYRLRLGFFASMEEAQKSVAQIKGLFPGCWVLKAPPDERQASLSSILELTPAPPSVPMPTVVAPTHEMAAASAPAALSDPSPSSAAPAPDDPITALMEQGRQAIANGDYPLAIRAYTKVLESPENASSQDAQEYLGLARERNGQAAHAVAEYENYLKLYPEGPGAERVRQRLAGLLTARDAPREKLPEQKPAQTEMRWSGAGNFSQYYRRDVSRIDTTNDSNVNQSALISDLDLSGRGRNSNYDIRARFNGGYTYDFLSGGENLTRLSSMYVDASSRNLGISGRLGRQTRGSGGVYQRFDGLLLSYQTGTLGRFNLVGGYPVDSATNTTINNDKVFYGLSADLPTWHENWNFGAYYITQDTGNLTDRESIGGEARYFDSVYSLLALLDYDIYFQQVNIFNVLGNWTYDDKTTYNFTISQSRSPFLSTSNALIGQTVTHVEDLLTTYTEDEIKDLALDRTANSRVVSAGLSRILHEKLQFNADFTVANLSSTPASGGVPASESTGNEYVYSAQLIGNSLLKEGDLGILGLIYSDASTTNTTTLTLDTRYPYNPAFRLNPRLRVDYREFKQDKTTQWTAIPSIRLDFRQSQTMDFEADIGAEWSNRELITNDTETTTGYYLYLGYNLGF